MSKRRKSLKSLSTRAFEKQNGKCFYCELPMWKNSRSEFSKQYSITEKCADLFMCTGEHLLPHSKGGKHSNQNIVAACWFCNQQRHRRKKELHPSEYKSLVQQRVEKGQWNIKKLYPDSDI